jgi:hypothetical protein
MASPFGLHLVWVHEKVSGRLPALDTVWRQIAGEMLQERGAERLADGLRRLRSLYDVRIGESKSDIAAGASERKGS